MFVDIPPFLQRVDFTRVRFLLEFQDSCRVGADAVLRLRRDLHQAARQVLGTGEAFAQLFDPPLPADPAALRRHQRPSPPFALCPAAGLPADFGPGDVLPLPAVFLGAGIQLIPQFLSVFRELGGTGLQRGEARFEVTAVEAMDPTGRFQLLWREGQSPDNMALPLLAASWWLESILPPRGPVLLDVVTPARLLAGGKPLFKGSFPRLFPFLLRRVTSMLYAHCGIEAPVDPGALLAAAAEVIETENLLRWEDWRVLAAGGERHDLGGLAGSVRLDGASLGSVLWVLGMATQLNVGRGAAYGAGHLALRPG